MAFILLRLLVLGVIAAAAGDVEITWLTPPRGLVPCVVAEAGRASRRPPPPLDADERPRSRAPRRLGGDGAEVSRKRNGTEGVYQCSVRHHAGSVLGYPVHWKFASMDKLFARHPENSTAYAGVPHALSCEVASAPTAAVSWLRNGESLPRNERYIQLSTQLVFTEVRKEDEGVYKCIATNSYLNKTRLSRSGWLQVVDPEESEPSMLPLRDEISVTAPRLSKVQLLCPVLGWPRPKITWELTPPGSSRTAVLESTEEVLELTSLEFDLEGVYKCSVDGHDHLSKVFNVTVTEPVTISLPPVSKEVIQASTVRFNCTAVGRPAPTITWYKDGVELVMGGRFNVRSSTSGDRYQLVVGGVTSADAGVYQCFARNVASIASSWAALSVTGAHAAAPASLSCWPLGGAVLLRWRRPSADVMAYTVQTTLPAWPGQPHNNTEETITVSEPLTTYGFQVRAYIRGTGKNVASDMSEAVYCQGQGVPVRIIKQGEDAVLVSWKEFAEHTRAAQWQLQHRRPGGPAASLTLPGQVHNYTLQVSPTQPLQVRVLGSKSEEWLPQNLTFLAWTSTSGQDDAREVTAVPEDLRVTQVLAREFTVKWRCEGAEVYAYLVCVRKPDGTKKCLDSYNNSTTVDGLEPETEYEVEVAAKAAGLAPGPPSQPLLVTTLSEGPEGFKDVTCKFVNASAVRVSWRAPPAKYSVLYSSELNVPVELWDRVDTLGNTALINGVDPSKDTYVMVTGYDPLIYSAIKTIPAQAPEVQWWWTGSGVRVRWRGAGRVLRYSQNLTRSLDLWPALSVAGTSVELTNLDPSLPTYVMVTAPGPSQRSQVFNIPVRPKETSSLYLGLGIAAGVCAVCALAAAAVCAWRRSKGARDQIRPRRRNVSTNEEDDEEAAEMKSVGGRLANGGGSRDAGEPLLNGHVHITENPQSKAPNGKMRKGVMTFDLARYEDPDATQETVLDEPCHQLLDTSRGDITSPPSFPKLPDDNMNSELNRSAIHLDNSKAQPTLQPNG